MIYVVTEEMVEVYRSTDPSAAVDAALRRPGASTPWNVTVEEKLDFPGGPGYREFYVVDGKVVDEENRVVFYDPAE